jgi:hypothetical protein
MGQDPDRDLQEVYDRDMGHFKAAWAAGVDVAVGEALRCCRQFRQVPPEWLEEAVIQLVTESPRKMAARRHRHAMDMVHFERWDIVNELRERKSSLPQGKTWDRAYDAASEMLRGTTASGSAESIKRSYKRVARDMREGQPAGKYLVSRLHAGIDKRAKPKPG